MTPCAYRRESRIGGNTIYHCLLMQASPAPCEGCTQASEIVRGVKSWVVPHPHIDTEPMAKAMQEAEQRSKEKAIANATYLPCRHRHRKMRLSCCAKYACKCTQCPLYKQEVSVQQCNECKWRLF